MLKIDLHKTFKTKKRTTKIVCKATFKLGSTSAIYGKSGIGKSTILRMIAGLEKAESGFIQYKDEVWFDEKNKINQTIADRNTGFVFQDFNLFPNMTVEGNLKYVSKKGISKETIHLLKVTDSIKLMANYPHELSGGEKQRISIIRALSQNPKLVLLDEPFSALDDDSIGDLINEIKMIQKEYGTTIILVSHRKDVIFEMANSMVYLKSDNTIEQGKPKDLIKKSF